MDEFQVRSDPTRTSPRRHPPSPRWPSPTSTDSTRPVAADNSRTPRKQRWLRASGFWWDETAIELGSVFPGRNADGTPHVGVRALRDLAEGARGDGAADVSSRVARSLSFPLVAKTHLTARSLSPARAQARPSRSCPPPGAW